MFGEGFKLALNNRSKRIVHIDNVPEGFAYGMCPVCKSELVASNKNKDTRKKETYFRHKVQSNCQGESLIHLWAKQVIADRQTVLGAEYTADAKAKDLARKFHFAELTKEAESLYFTHVELEQRLTSEEGVRTPDLLCDVTDGSALAIEIFVSNAVTERKASFFIEQKLDCLEIDLSNMPSWLQEEPDAFEQYVINAAPRSWIYCSRYPELDSLAFAKAEKEAKQASEIVNARRDKKRSLKSQWRESHSDFLQLVEAYIDPDNQAQVETIYQDQLVKPGSLSNSYKLWFDANFDGIPDVLNIPVKGELGFKCHRSVWQWEVYKRVVLYSHYKSQQGSNNPVRKTRATRGYEESARMLAWYDHAPKWSPQMLYGEIKDIVPLNRICIEAERISGKPLMAEKDKPDSLVGLKVHEWRELPKPVCTIRRYIKELLRQSVLEVYEGDTYIVPHGAKLPLYYDVSRANMEIY